MSAAGPSRKVCTRAEAVAWRRAARGRVVFTNGVFDLLHRGHVDLLQAARGLGDALIVAINTDASVQRLKGPGRPVRGEHDRAYVLAALEMVDAVTTFGEDTPLELIRLLGPDVLVKGGDYALSSIVGAADVLRGGGEVHVVPLTPGHSTTHTIQRLHDADANEPTP